jgi:hypothetical protein
MRVFIIAVVAVAVLATGWSFTLNHLQESIAQVNAGSSVRLDWQEAVNPIGRQAHES